MKYADREMIEQDLEKRCYRLDHESDNAWGMLVESVYNILNSINCEDYGTYSYILNNLVNIYDAGIYAQYFDSNMQYDIWDE